jgi:hypothetical protein
MFVCVDWFTICEDTPLVTVTESQVVTVKSNTIFETIVHEDPYRGHLDSS